MSARSVASAIVIACALVAFGGACVRENSPNANADATATSTANGSANTSADAAGASESSDAGPRANGDDAGAPSLDPAFLVASPKSVKPIGNTSLVFKIVFDGGLVAAYKPRSHKPLGATRYRAEIAAYRLARALGIERNVPVAVPRKLDAAELRELLVKTPHGAKADELAPDEDGRVRGALMPWLTYEKWPLDLEPLRSRTFAWLTKREPLEPADRTLAQQVSTMFLFDYFTANWDRMSGGNVAIQTATQTVLYVDNDGAFYEAPPGAQLADQLATIRRMTRFSKSFVTALRALGLHEIEKAVGEEVPGIPLLAKKVIDMAEERRQRILKIVDQKIATDGEANALAFE